ncbi:unnamed protein product [Thelazia callipaeda]|uniref:glutathione transferase n=1 Tax=Thelazia callipaeda TaxID=103827 RepID=A0A0N5D5B7_THECL|nr:unnamed protein product [Thelazia callipaeda]
MLWSWHLLIIVSLTFAVKGIAAKANSTEAAAVKTTVKSDGKIKTKVSEGKNYKLTYFNVRGRAEVIRLLFALANVSYDDNRITRQEWTSLKPKMPYGQVPVLEENGKLLAQSHAIERYLARNFGFMGSNAWEAAKIEELMIGTEGLWEKLLKWAHGSNETEKEELLTELEKDEISSFLTRYEGFLTSSSSSYLVGKKISLADLTLFNVIKTFVEYLPADYLKQYPKLNKFMTKIGSNPQIKKWIEMRPKTNF